MENKTFIRTKFTKIILGIFFRSFFTVEYFDFFDELPKSKIFNIINYFRLKKFKNVEDNYCLRLIVPRSPIYFKKQQTLFFSINKNSIVAINTKSLKNYYISTITTNSNGTIKTFTIKSNDLINNDLQ